MKDQDRQDLAFVADVLSRFQQSCGHGELVVKVQDGRVVLVEEVKKHKPGGNR